MLKRLSLFNIKTLKQKLICSASALMLLSLIITFVISYVVLNNMVLSKINEYNVNNLKTVSSGFYDFIKKSEIKMENIAETNRVYLNEYFELTDSYEKIQISKTIETELFFNMQSNKEFNKIVIVTKNRSFGSVYVPEFLADEITSKKDIFFLNNGTNGAYGNESVFIIKTFGKYIQDNNINEGFILGKNINIGDNVATLIVRANPKVAVIPSEYGEVFIFHENGFLLWGTGDPDINNLPSDVFAFVKGSENNSFSFTVKDKDLYISYYKTIWSPFCFINIVKVNQILYSIRGYLLAAGIVFLFIAVLFFIVIIRYADFLVVPINSLIKILRNIEDFDEKEFVTQKSSNKFMRWYQNLTINYKMLIFYCINTILPSLILTAFLMIYSQNLVSERVKLLTEGIAIQVGKNIEHFLKNINNTFVNLATFEDVQLITDIDGLNYYDFQNSYQNIYKDKTDFEVAKHISNINNYIIKNQLIQRDILYINILDKNWDVKYSTNNIWEGRSNVSDYSGAVFTNKNKNFEWIKENLDNNYGVQSYISKFYLKIPTTTTQADKTNVKRNYYTHHGYIQIGVLEIAIRSRFDLVRWETGGYCYIIDKKGAIITHNTDKEQSITPILELYNTQL